MSWGTFPDCTDLKLDTPPAALVAPNGYMGSKARIYKYGGHQALSHREVRKQMTVAIGVDVGKANLDVSVSEGPVVRFANTKPGITKLLKYLEKHDVKLVVCEATGGYERALVNRLREAEVAVHVAHPTRVRAFAKACGYEAKTDPRDAQVLSRYGRVFPEAQVSRDEFDPEREELRDILNRRRQFVAQRVQELGRLDKGTSSITIRSAKRHITWLEKEIARLDREYQTVLDRNAPLAERAALYRSVPGIGPLTAAILVAFCRNWVTATAGP